MIEFDKIDKKDAILDAAERLFSEIGYDACSTRSIAAKAGVNMAMLSYYFGSKDGLYKAILERRLGIVEETFSVSNDQDSIWDQLYNCIEAETDQTLTDTYFQKLIHRELSLEQRSDMTDYITDNLARRANEVKKLLSKGIENGSFRNVDIELTTATIFGTLYYLVNSSRVASRVLNKDVQNPMVISDEIKPRVKKHLRDLLSSYLKKRPAGD